jgi:hypothetical protein
MQTFETRTISREILLDRYISPRGIRYHSVHRALTFRKADKILAEKAEENDAKRLEKVLADKE